ncbi:VWA domain-containing protein [Agromyces allii]|uniref:VWFA domain-containing protein n=1 Tax=Agromyces allii TaxID=393607 RepID=A0ABP5BFX2_9MICO|nr:VWA domain-containing protein [Agromyces allii]
MKSNWFGTRDDDRAQHPRRSRRQREAERSRSLRGLIASVAVGALLVVGLPTMAFAEATDPAADPSVTTETTDPTTATESTDPATETATDPATETPSEEPSETPSETPSEEPSEAPVEETPSEEPEPTKPPLKSAKAAAPQIEQQAAAILAAPPANSANNSVVVVKVGDDRDLGNAGTINPLAGVTLALFPTQTGGSQLADAWATCVSDAAGDCWFQIPNTGTAPNNANRDRELWVRQVGTPSGYFANTLIRTGDADGGSSQQTPYSFRIGNASNSYQLRGNTTYNSTSQFMVGTGNSNRSASGGTWQTSRNNIALPQQCGLDVALVMDLSGSVSPSIVQARAAGVSLVQALEGTPSRVGLFTFGPTAPQAGANNINRPITAVSTPAGVSTVSGWINGLTATGSTNWDRGIYQVATSAASYDVAIVLTDGNPTVYGTETAPGDFTRIREVENAIFSANAVKKEGTRVIALGVGSGVTAPSTALNLAAISGPTKYNGSNSATADYYQEASYTAAAAALRALALGNCQGGVSVVKQVIPPGGTIANAQPAAGWAIGASNPTNGITVGAPNPANGQTDGTGAINYPLNIPGGTTGTVTIRETQQAGYTNEQQSGFNAVCRDLSTNPATNVAVTNAPVVNGQPGVVVPVSATAAISCTFYNRAPNPAAQVVVNKLWAVNGAPAVPHGSQDPSLTGISTINGGQVGFGNQQGGFSQGQVVPVGESLGQLPLLCTITSQILTKANGVGQNVDVSAGKTYAATLIAGLNTYEITNTVSCPTKLTLFKTVQGGPAAKGDWTLTSLPPVDGPGGPYLPGPTGADSGSGVVANVTPTAYYPLTETGNTANTALYVQPFNGDPAQRVPGSSGTWNCVTLNANGGTGGAGNNAGGLNGGVRVPFGTWVGCTAVNQTSQVQLNKVVDPSNGGSAVPNNWDLRTTPASTSNGEVTSTVKSGTTVFLRPGSTYNLSELNGPAGYDQKSLQCNTGPNDTYVDATSVNLPATDSAICVFTNIAKLPKLSLDKVVSPSGVANKTSWTLSASRADNAAVVASGAGGTGGYVDVPSGVAFNLAETTGLPNSGEFQAGTWQCTVNGGAPIGGPLLPALAPGDQAACVVTNTLKPVVPTITKTAAIPTPNANGSWTVGYDIVVTNPSNFLDLTYSLTDQLKFGSNVTVNSASYQRTLPAPPGASTAWSVPFANVQAFADEPLLVKGTTHTWHVTVNATVAPGANFGGTSPTACDAGTPGTVGFLNTATMTVSGVDYPAQDCSVPVKPTIAKVGGTAVDNGDGTWTLPYTITVTNPSATTGVVYDLKDTLDLPASAEQVGLPTVVSKPAGVTTEPGWTGAVPNDLLANDIALAGGAAAHVYQISVKVRLGADDPAYTCPNPDGLNNTATLVSGNQTTDATGCVTVNPPTITHTKTVVPGSVVQGSDGKWTIAYDIVVTNGGAVGGTYSLADSLHFGTGVNLSGATYVVTKDGAPYVTPWAGSGNLAVDAYLAAGTATTYRITVAGIALVGPDLTPAQSACPSDSSNGAFNNTATLKVAGVSTDKSACDSPSAPKIVKSDATSVQQLDGTWNVSYKLTVSNTDPGAKASYYSLTDDPAFPAGVAYISYQIDANAPVTPYDGSPFTVASNKAIAAGASDVYTVLLNVDAPVGDIEPEQLECATENNPDGVGFLNNATVTSGEITRSDDDCTNISRGGEPTVVKDDPTVTQDGDGVWTIVYDVTVTGNSEFVSRYTLKDTLRFGPEIDIQSASWTGETSGSWADPTADPTAELVPTNKVIGIDAVHTYTVTVTATVDAAAFEDPTTNTCSFTENDPNVGFLNEAALTSNGIVSTDTGCGLPAEPEIEKSTVGDVAKVGDHWEATYEITVSNLSADQDLVYDLNDTPDFAGDVTITDREVSSADVTVNPAWNGASPSTDTIVEDETLPGGATHTFTVVVSFTVDDVAGSDELLCEGDGGKGLLNGAEVVSGDSYTDDACYDVPIVVELHKDWVINGSDPIAWDSDDLPDGFTAQAVLDGEPVAWDTSYGPYALHDEVNVDESDVVIPEGCTLEDTTGTGDQELVDAYNTFTVTNIVECTQTVTVTKVVQNPNGGDGVATDWTVSVSGTDDGFGGPGTASGPVEVGVGYTLNEVSLVWVNGVQYEVTATWTCESESGEDAFTLVSTPGSVNATLTVNTYGASVDCEIENSDIAPNLEIEKFVAPDEVAEDFPPTLWHLSASDNGTAVIEGDGGASGEVKSNTPYDLAESADFPEADEFEAGDWICVDNSQEPPAPVILDDDAVTLQPGQDVYCSITNTAKPATYVVDKTVDSAEQQPDGTWLIDYTITVENTSGVSPLEYDLTDDLSNFGEGITIDEASWSSSYGDDGTWDGLPDTLEETLATDQPLGAGDTDTFEVEVVATVTQDAWTEETTACTTGDMFGEGGFRNVATVTIDGLPTVRTACDEPGRADALKSVVGSPVDNNDGTFTVEYEIAVTNASGKDLYYDLSDTPEFPAGTTFTATATDPDGNPVADWTGVDPDTVLAEGRLIPAAGDDPTVETWTITAVVDVSTITDIDTVKCVKGETGRGFYNGGEFTSGTIVTPLEGCVDIPVAKLTLVKHVDNSALGNLPITGGVASDWNLSADGPTTLVDVAGNEDGVSTIVSVGDYSLSEAAIADPSSPLVPDYYEASDWSCEPTEAAEASVTLVAGDDVTCTITNTVFPVDVGIEKEADLPEGVTAVDDTEDNTFDWVLTVTNNGRAVANLEVTDLIDDQLEITGPATFDPAENWTEDTTGNAFSATYSGIYAAGQVTTIRIPVKVLPVEVEAPPAVGPDDPAPVLPPLNTDPIPNEACVAILGIEDSPERVAAAVDLGDAPVDADLLDLDVTNDCADAEVPVKRVDAGVYVRCIADVPWLYFDVQATDNVTPGDITVTWKSADGTLTKVQTIPWDARTGRLLWPGAAVDANGIPYQFPGWRPITEEDLANPGSVVPGTRFLDLILDETVDTYPWRDMDNGATITFSVNPSQSVLAVYPQALPTCAIDRPAELQIDKTASVTSTKAGGDFSYSLQVTSVGTGATNPTEVFDEIPANLRVDSITTAPAPAFPRWEDCEVTGKDSSGYGGTLHCDLLGQLGPNFTTAPVIDLAVHVKEGTTVSTIENTGEVCWQTADDPDPATECAEDMVPVTLLGGTAITGFAGGPWVWGAAGLLILGSLAVTWVVIRRRREAAAD